MVDSTDHQVEIDNERIGKAIASLRGARSQQSVAEEMRTRGHDKWSQSTVWSVEKGSRPLRLVEAVDLATVLNVRLDDLLRGPESGLQQARLTALAKAVEAQYSLLVPVVADFISLSSEFNDVYAELQATGALSPYMERRREALASKNLAQAIRDGLFVAMEEQDMSKIDHLLDDHMKRDFFPELLPEERDG